MKRGRTDDSDNAAADHQQTPKTKKSRQTTLPWGGRSPQIPCVSGGSQVSEGGKSKTDEKSETLVADAMLGPGAVGAIVHWGPWAVPSFDSVASAKARRIQNGSEWYLQRLLTKPTAARPCSGWRETQAYHEKQYGEGTTYADLAKTFLTTSVARLQSWPDEWLSLFKVAGASYAILTAKHHDGFCMWPTKTARPAISDGGGPSADLVGAFKAAAVKHGLKFGLYYSWGEFNRGCTRDYVEKAMKPQVRELVDTYEPDLFWFDGDWMCATKSSQRAMEDCCALIRRKLPHCLLNDRVGHMADRRADANHRPPHVSYRVYDDRAIPATRPTVPWEHVNTIGYSWGLNRQQSAADYKTPEQLLDLHRRVTNLGGRFLINVGPDADGALCPVEAETLRRLGELRRSLKSSDSTNPGPEQ